MSVGPGQLSERMKVTLDDDIKMEAKSCGLLYVCLSRPMKEVLYAFDPVPPLRRVMYLNDHPSIEGRRREDARLEQMHTDTIRKYADVCVPGSDGGQYA